MHFGYGMGLNQDQNSSIYWIKLTVYNLQYVIQIKKFYRENYVR